MSVQSSTSREVIRNKVESWSLATKNIQIGFTSDLIPRCHVYLSAQDQLCGLLGDLGEPLVDNAGDFYLVNSGGSAATTYIRQVVVVLLPHQPKCLGLFVSLENWRMDINITLHCTVGQNGGFF